MPGRTISPAQALPGYEAAECVLRDPAARVLAAAQADLAAQGLGVKVYDCYRPARAVRAMLTWANADKSGATDQRFFPEYPEERPHNPRLITAHSAIRPGSRSI